MPYTVLSRSQAFRTVSHVLPSATACTIPSAIARALYPYNVPIQVSCNTEWCKHLTPTGRRATNMLYLYWKDSIVLRTLECVSIFYHFNILKMNAGMLLALHPSRRLGATGFACNSEFKFWCMPVQASALVVSYWLTVSLRCHGAPRNRVENALHYLFCATEPILRRKGVLAGALVNVYYGKMNY